MAEGMPPMQRCDEAEWGDNVGHTIHFDGRAINSNRVKLLQSAMQAKWHRIASDSDSIASDRILLTERREDDVQLTKLKPKIPDNAFPPSIDCIPSQG